MGEIIESSLTKDSSKKAIKKTAENQVPEFDYIVSLINGIRYIRIRAKYWINC